jgi:hyperosmotically inducible periplasmic protein
MKKLLFAAAAALVVVGCGQSDNSANESAGAQRDQIEQNRKAQKDALNAQKDSVSQNAKQEKNQIDAQAKAEKDQINAKKDELDAQAKAAKAQADAQASAAKAQGQAVNESAGAGTASDNSDSAIKARVRAAILGNTADSSNPASVSANPNAPQNLNVDVSNGKVTLKGTVATDQAKMDAAQRAQKIQGVTSVDNQLEIKSQ